MRYPFSFALPNGIPPSYAAYVGGAQYVLKGHCGLKAKLKIDPRVQVAVPVVGSLNNTQVQLYSTPRQAQNAKSFLFAKGKCSATVSMASAATYAGHTLAGTVVVQNQSKKTLTRIKAKVVQVVTFRAQGHHRIIRTKGPKVVLCEQAVPGGGSFEAAFQITIPNTGEFVPSVHSGTNDIMRIEHFIVVVCDASFARDLEVMFPVHLSPTPSQLEPAPMPAMPPLAPIMIDSATMQTAQEAGGVVQMASAPMLATPLHMMATPHGAPPSYAAQPPVQQQAFVKQQDFFHHEKPFNK